jgi:1,4-dihydroxy-2-naphthoyl-CoA synthase
LTAGEAVDLGIAVRMVAADSLMTEVLEMANQIAAGSPLALRSIKALMRAHEAPFVAAARAREDEAYAQLLGSAANVAALDRFGSTGRT